MSTLNPSQPTTIAQFADRFRNEMIPLGNRFSYFCAAVSLSEDDLRDFLEEPIAALPPAIAASLPPIQILLVPYLERGARPERGKTADVRVSVEKPLETRASASGLLITREQTVLAFAIKDQEVADYHYTFYRALAELIVDGVGAGILPAYTQLVREELAASAHGEVDDASWRWKQNLLRRPGRIKEDSRQFTDYIRHSFIDTMTLYLHGICCDIDVETGPRQLPSRWMRRRLTILRDAFAPPKGYAVFPEDIAPAS